MNDPNPITVHEAAEAVYDMVGTAANIASPLTALDWQLHGHRFTVTLAREHNGHQTDHRNFVVTLNANEDNPVLSPETTPTSDDMAVLMDEAGLLLLYATRLDHENKQLLIQILRTIRGDKTTGWKIDTKNKTVKRT